MMTDPAASYHVFEEAVEKHARLLGEARNLLARISRDPENPKYQERLLKILRSFRILRSRLERQGRRLPSVNEALLGHAATLIEYMVLVGLEEELDVISRALKLSGRAEILSREAESLGEDRKNITRLLGFFSRLLDSFPENSGNPSTH